MNWPPSLFRFVKIFSIVLVASCERVFLTSATPSGLFVAMCAPLLLLFWLALANDLEALPGALKPVLRRLSGWVKEKILRFRRGNVPSHKSLTREPHHGFEAGGVPTMRCGL
jgi:hypothetical protein